MTFSIKTQEKEAHYLFMEEPSQHHLAFFPFEKAQSLPSSQIDLQFKTHVHQLKGLGVMSSEKLRANFRLA